MFGCDVVVVVAEQFRLSVEAALYRRTLIASESVGKRIHCLSGIIGGSESKSVSELQATISITFTIFPVYRVPWISSGFPSITAPSLKTVAQSNTA
jgi:hypothetical protein